MDKQNQGALCTAMMLGVAGMPFAPARQSYDLHPDPRPEPTERDIAKAISIAAVRRAVRNEKRAKWANSNRKENLCQTN